jgi:hypothetical protein
MRTGGFITEVAEGTEDTEDFVKVSGMDASARRSSMAATSSVPSASSATSVLKSPAN